MDIEKLIERLRNAGGGPEGIKMCQDAATALSALRAENERLRKDAKPNCIRCDWMHPDNGNCTIVGGFCTAVPAAHCPLIPKLRAELEQVKREKEAAVADLRQMCIGANTCAFCTDDPKCERKGPGRKTVEPCWRWRGPEEG